MTISIAIADASRPKLRLPPANLMSRATRSVAVTPDIQGLLDLNAVVAVGVSAGKDSVAVALAVDRYLNEIGHTGPRVLVHADLGRVEWKDSLPYCERMAVQMGWELMTVRRQAGDMLARWEGRWESNVRRYTELDCVKVILPWSTPSLRFCTSELKVAVISSELRKRFPTENIVNVTGVRREESDNRAKMPVSQVMDKLVRKNAKGYTWNAVIEWKLGEVLQEIADGGMELHEAYTVYGASRLSCAYCIMSTAADLMAAAGCADNHPLYVQMVELEARSGFAFQGSRWLADVAPHLLSEDLRQRVLQAKEGAKRRVAIEARLPKHLEYTKGWPTCMPTAEEAELIAGVRREVAEVLGIVVKHTTPESVLARYAELLALKATKDAMAAAKDAKKAAKSAKAESKARMAALGDNETADMFAGATAEAETLH